MISDEQLGFYMNWLGILLMSLIVGYHYIIADPKLAQ